MFDLRYETEYGRVFLGDAKYLVVKEISTIDDNSVDLICTDPPYPKKFQDVYNYLGVGAKRILKSGASLLTLCGHYQLPFVIKTLDQYLKYRWIIHYDHYDSGHARMLMGIEVCWKPYLWYVKDKYGRKNYVMDTIRSDGKRKSHHVWEQNTAYAEWAIENFTDENDLVVDPFFGSGTLGIVAEKLKRRWIGIDNDPKAIDVAIRRITDG